MKPLKVYISQANVFVLLYNVEMESVCLIFTVHSSHFIIYMYFLLVW